MWKLGFEATALKALTNLVRMAGAIGGWAAGVSGLLVARDGKFHPRRRNPPGTPPGVLAPRLKVCLT